MKQAKNTNTMFSREYRKSLKLIVLFFDLTIAILITQSMAFFPLASEKERRGLPGIPVWRSQQVTMNASGEVMHCTVRTSGAGNRT